jgi:hypothetical protein
LGTSGMVWQASRGMAKRGMYGLGQVGLFVAGREGLGRRGLWGREGQACPVGAWRIAASPGVAQARQAN